MPEIRGFSPEVHRAVRKFFLEDRPAVKLTLSREPDMASAPKRLQSALCIECGWVWRPPAQGLVNLAAAAKAAGEELPAGSLPEDMIRAISIQHCYDNASRSQWCGGQMVISYAPV